MFESKTNGVEARKESETAIKNFSFHKAACKKRSSVYRLGESRLCLRFDRLVV